MVQKPYEPGPDIAGRPAIYKDLVLFQLAALVLLLDQFTKFLVREFLTVRESFPEEGFFRITHTFNTGSAFGLFRDQNFPLILVSIVGITILVLIYQKQRRPSNLLRLSLGLQLGGATGNLLDRLRMGHVTDFLDVGSWPIFNLADSSIVVGLLMLGWIFLASDGSKRTDGSHEALEQNNSPGTNTPMEHIAQDATTLANEMEDSSEVVPTPFDQPEDPGGFPVNHEDEGCSARQGIPPTRE